jgi:tRNA threonylcarbamoyl adenosine modification protein (Sua5/YciO/YrdC/YwlC family)
MGKEVDLKKGELSRHVNKALKAISDGYVIAIPLEHSYAFACDAFKQDSVRAMNVLHGSPLFTAAQVLVGSSRTAQGVIREITPEISALMKKFWPGLLSLNLRPQLGLSWDLGDANQLDRISIRTPKSKFAKALLAESGPLAVTSGARIGRPAPKELSDIFTLHSDLAFQFNGGKLRQGAATTIVEADAEGVRVLRVGAISLAQIQEIVPSASLI